MKFDNITAYKAHLKEYLYSVYPSFNGYVDMISFEEDFENLMNIPRILVRNKESINVPLLLNRIIILHNVFGKELIKCIPYLITDDRGLIIFNTIAIYLGFLKPNPSLHTDKKFEEMISGIYDKKIVNQKEWRT